MFDRMVELAKQQPGYLGHESAREDVGITASYWENLDTIRQWKAETEHLFAQQAEQNRWYSAYQVRIS